MSLISPRDPIGDSLKDQAAHRARSCPGPHKENEGRQDKIANIEAHDCWVAGLLGSEGGHIRQMLLYKWMRDAPT